MRAFAGCLVERGQTYFASMPGVEVVGSRHVLFRGYIANRSELRACLPGGRETGASWTDAELIAQADERWGADLSRHVLGEFAVALFAPADGRLLLAHDELGLIPLFYSVERDGIHFSSHLEALVEETGRGELDDDHIATWLARAENIGASTPYAHLRRLLPGESLTWRRGRRSTHDCWTLSSMAPMPAASADGIDERFRRLLREAVEGALPETGKTWCELSGGLDSSTVLAIAGRSRPDIEAFSWINSRSRTADERPWMEAFLRERPAPHHCIDIDRFAPFSRQPAHFRAEPNAWITNDALDQAYVDCLTSHGVDVLLTGEGGDSVLFGDVQRPFFLADRLRRGAWGAAWREAAEWTQGSNDIRSPTHALFAFGAAPLLPWRRGFSLEGEFTVPPWIAKPFAKRQDFAGRRRAAWLPKAAGVGEAYVLQRVMFSARLIASHTNQRDIDCSIRNPLMNRSLIEFTLCLPWEAKLRAGGDRLIQRRALTGVLPSATIGRTDKGGSGEPWFEGLDRGVEVRRALTERPRTVERGWLDLDEWRLAVDRARVGSTMLAKFRAAASTELWLQQVETLSATGTQHLRQSALNLSELAPR